MEVIKMFYELPVFRDICRVLNEARGKGIPNDSIEILRLDDKVIISHSLLKKTEIPGTIGGTAIQGLRRKQYNVQNMVPRLYQ